MSECERSGWIKRCLFEARYEMGVPDMSKLTFTKMNGVDGNKLIESCRPKTYIHDICIRCGKVVARSDANTKKEP